MLSELRIRNFVLIDDISFEMGEGLNVLTGETGAGKSIIVDALSLALGERAKTNQVRRSTDRATVEAVFDVERRSDVTQSLEAIDIPVPDGRICIRRVIRSDGKSTAYLNDSPVTLKALQEIVGRLVDLHGQHEHQSLLDRSIYRELIDAYGKLEKEAEDVSLAYGKWKSARDLLRNLEGDDRERARRIDQLTFEIEDVERVKPAPGEEDRLGAERNVLRNVARIEEAVRNALALLEGEREEDSAVLDRLSRAVHEIARLNDVGPTFEEWHNQAASALSTLESVAGDLSGYLSRLEGDPDRLDAIESRLFAFQELKRKYAPDLPGVLEFLKKCREEREGLKNWESAMEETRKKIRKAQSAYLKAASTLSEKRTEVAKSLARQIRKEMRSLGMESAVFHVEVVQEEGEPERFRPSGLDRVEFLVTTNPGEEPRPLASVASGGEISRIMLGIKTVLARVDRVPTLVFDELDLGIGGRVADTVGERLAALSRDHQVLCVTHLAQIASRAGTHYRVEKKTSGNRTTTGVARLEGKDREEEIVRMIGARPDSQASRKVARELIKGT